MINLRFCQSCGMPLDSTGLEGTEADGRINEEYCIECYQSGSFVDPATTMEDMRHKIINILEKDQVPPDVIEEAVLRVPTLRRWNGHSLPSSP